MIVGSGFPSLSEIEIHAPIPEWRFDVGHIADAYGTSHAACLGDTSQQISLSMTSAIPVHSVVHDPLCVHDFMALHQAHVLHEQCLACHSNSLTSRSCPSLRPSLHTTRHALRKTVIFSPQVEVCISRQDEVGIALPFWMHEGALYTWKCKPWALRPSDGKQCHFPDHHSQGLASARLSEYRELEQRLEQQQPDHIQQLPDYVQELEHALQRFGDLDAATNQRHMEVLTWYLHGHNNRDCRRPRIVRLNKNANAWETRLRRAWRDLIVQNQAVHIYVILPEPPITEWDTHVAQVVLIQQPPPFERAVLFTALYYTQHDIITQRIMRFCDTQIHLQDAINMAEVPIQSTMMQERLIRAYYGWRPILRPPEAPIDLIDGASVVLHVRPPDDPGLRPPAHEPKR